MQKLKFTNSRAESIVFDSNGPFVFWKIEGVEIPMISHLTTQAMGQHGFSYHGSLLETRHIELYCHIHGRSGEKEMYELRRKMNKILNPINGVGTLYYINDRGVFTIPAICESNTYQNKIREVQSLKLSFICPSPFFREEEENELKLAYVEGGLEFPVVTKGYFGTLGYRELVDNDSDANLPMEIYIDGGAINPVIYNKSTNKKLMIEQNMKNYEKIYINTDPNNLEVSLISIDPLNNKTVKKNAYAYLSVDSDLLTLAPGINEIEFQSDDANKKIKVRIKFHKMFVGV